LNKIAHSKWPLIIFDLMYVMVGHAQTRPADGQLKKVADSFYVYESGRWRTVHTHREYVVDAPRREQIGWTLYLDSLPVKEETWDSTHQAFLEPYHPVPHVIHPLTGPSPKDEFTGTWVLMPNSQKSISGELYPNSFDKQVTIRQTPDSIGIERVTGSDIGDITTAETYALDGKPMDVPRVDKRRSVITVSRDCSQSMITLSSILYSPDNKPEYRFTEVWAAMDSGGRHQLVLKKKSESLLYLAPARVSMAWYEMQ
jgi:hypothetical protein